MIDDVLKELGFSPYKTQVYKAMMKLKKARAWEIAAHSGVPTSKVYEVLNWLQTKGYVGIISRKPITYVLNEPRKTLNQGINDRITLLETLQEQVQKESFPEAPTETPFEIVYGPQAFFKRVTKATANAQKTLVSVFSTWESTNAYLRAEQRFTERGGKVRLLGPINKQTRARVKQRAKGGASVKHLASPEVKFAVWDSSLVKLTLSAGLRGENYSLWVKHPDFAQAMEEYFNKLWKKAIAPKNI